MEALTYDNLEALHLDGRAIMHDKALNRREFVYNGYRFHCAWDSNSKKWQVASRWLELDYIRTIVKEWQDKVNARPKHYRGGKFHLCDRDKGIYDTLQRVLDLLNGK